MLNYQRVTLRWAKELWVSIIFCIKWGAMELLGVSQQRARSYFGLKPHQMWVLCSSAKSQVAKPFERKGTCADCCCSWWWCWSWWLLCQYQTWFIFSQLVLFHLSSVDDVPVYYWWPLNSHHTCIGQYVKTTGQGKRTFAISSKYLQSPLFAYWSTYFEGVLPWIASGLVLFETGIFPNSTGISCLFSIQIKMQLQDIQQPWTNPKKHIIA